MKPGRTSGAVGCERASAIFHSATASRVGPFLLTQGVQILQVKSKAVHHTFCSPKGIGWVHPPQKSHQVGNEHRHLNAQTG